MQEITLENLGSILKKIRKEKCPTQQEVAEGIHVEQSVIYSWERGAGNPYFITIYKLCRSFGMSLDEFLGIEKKKHYTLTISCYRLFQSSCHVIHIIRISQEISIHSIQLILSNKGDLSFTLSCSHELGKMDSCLRRNPCLRQR